MESLPEIWCEVQKIAGVFESHTPKFNELTYEDLTDIRDRLNKCAENVQTVRDAIVWK